MSRVLVISSGFGEGHNAAARNLAAALDQQHGPGTAQICDLFSLASPRLNALSRSAYLQIINHAPRLWSALYAGLGNPKVLPSQLWFFRKEIQVLTKLLLREAPAAVCSTYPLYGYFGDKLRAEKVLRVPFFNVVTDSISIHPMWTRPACDAWFVPNAETSAVMQGMGVPASKIIDSGFPVQDFFAKNQNLLTPPDLSAGARPRVLYVINSGVLHAEETARRLISDTDWELTLAVGRDEGLRRRLETAARPRAAHVKVMGWTDRIPYFLLTHNAVISKAGGATTQEAIAGCCPMIVSQIVPGQEEGNYELLRRRGIGAYAPNPEAILSTLQRAFAGGGSEWNRWRTSLREISRPHSADEIARQVTRLSFTTFNG